MCSRRLSWLLGTLFLLMACGFAQPPPPPPDVAHMASLDQLAPMLTDPSADLRAGAARRLGQLNDTHAAPLLLARLADDAPAVRAAAALALAEMKDAAITPALLAKLHDKDDGVRTCATTALVRRHDPAVLPLLRTAAIDPDTAYRTAALTALSRLHDTQSVTLLCTALHDAATDARVAAAHGLGRLPASEIAIATLLATLADPDLKVRDAAAEALAAYGAPAAIPALVTALHDPARHLTDAPGLLRRFGDSGADAVLAALQAEQNVTVQQIYLAALGTLQSPRSLEPLAALLKSPTPAIAGGALDALIRSRAPGSIYTLTALHEEIFGPVKPFATGRTPRLRMPWTTDPRVVDALRVALPTGGGRIQAAGYFNDPTLITALAALAKTNPDLQRAIIPALSESGDARGLEPLLALAKSPDWGLAFAAGMALQQLNDIPNPTPLLTTLSDPNTGNAKRAIDALGVQADARAVPALLEVLKGEQPIDVKVSAALALGKIGDARAYEPLLAALQNWPAAQRGDAAQALGTLGDARAIEPLAAALVGADALTRLRIGAGLLKLGDTRGRDELLAALQGGNQLTQGLAGLALLDAHEPKAFDAGLAMLTAPAVDRNTRNLVLYYMAREGDARTVPYVADLLDDPSSIMQTPAVREFIICAMHNIHDPAVAPVLTRVLAEDDNEAVRLQAAAGLALYGSATALDLLIATVQNPAAPDRVTAAYALAGIPTGRAVPALVTALQDPEPLVRVLAARGLAQHGDVRATPTLLAAVKNDHEPLAQLLAARVLGTAHVRAGVPALLALAQKGDVEARLTALRALCAIGDPSELPALGVLLDDDRSRIREAAAGTLAQLGDAHAGPALTNALKDDTGRVRAAAAQALGRLKIKDAADDLIALLKTEPVPAVSTAAIDALKAISGEDFGADTAKWQAWWEKNKE